MEPAIKITPVVSRGVHSLDMRWQFYKRSQTWIEACKSKRDLFVESKMNYKLSIPASAYQDPFFSPPCVDYKYLEYLDKHIRYYNRWLLKWTELCNHYKELI